MHHSRLRSRRSFLQAALAAPIAGMVTTYSPLDGKDGTSEASSIVARVTLDKELYDCDAVLNGRLYFRIPAAGPVMVRWVDSFGGSVEGFHPPNLASQAATIRFYHE